MKKIFLGFGLIICILSAMSQTSGMLTFYVGTYTTEGGKGIVQCKLNNANGEILVGNSFGEIINPSFLKISPDNKFLYAVTETKDGFVTAFEIEKNGGLKQINKQKSNGDDPCQIDVSDDGKFVGVANYSSGTLSLYPVDNYGGLNPSTSVITNKGSGPNKLRQAGSHAHSIKFSPFSNEVFNADLGTDQFNILTLNNDKLYQSVQKFVKMEPGAGPRHFIFSQNGKFIYIINELNSTVSQLQKVNDNWELVLSVSTLPEGFKGESFCADIHISADGRFLYGSNRGNNSIVVFEINKISGTLKTIGFVSVEGNWPRNFALSPDGGFLLAANQKSGNITVFKINKATGMPEFTGKEIKMASPVCVEFLK